MHRTYRSLSYRDQSTHVPPVSFRQLCKVGGAFLLSGNMRVARKHRIPVPMTLAITLNRSGNKHATCRRYTCYHREDSLRCNPAVAETQAIICTLIMCEPSCPQATSNHRVSTSAQLAKILWTSTCECRRHGSSIVDHNNGAAIEGDLRSSRSPAAEQGLTTKGAAPFAGFSAYATVVQIVPALTATG